MDGGCGGFGDFGGCGGSGLSGFSSTGQIEGGSVNNGGTLDYGEADYCCKGDDKFTCLFIDHQDCFTKAFCDCARWLECRNVDEDAPWRCCLCVWILVPCLSAITLGQESYHITRTISGICYPLWLLLILFAFLFTLIHVILAGFFFLLVFVFGMLLLPLLCVYVICIKCGLVEDERFNNTMDSTEQGEPENSVSNV